ncbi:iron-sulfur cluster assembly scaffold protein [Allopontixanthobacter sediminis]|uniref:Iron-sulfur cluster assembly scaffold protein n=1 Tax=Allopontixanthobacter sediminis TaxID=1689985 RepID=A0A845B0B1_9SPHN|nr:iron-sulfur cluster assembly scaffold protein [Allopontixanthobacter sediminis]MXP43626.1 iron-sulfur cluster assembly scaffold protein [Allopontixanthobacter sediminis]
MTAQTPTKLYTPELLALAVTLAGYPLDPALPLAGEARSRTCGSSVKMGVSTDGEGRISSLGMQVTACAVGQAAAATFAAAAAGRSNDGIAEALKQLELWLAGAGDLPGWPGMSALVPALDHPGRHGAILLPWKAAADALCKAEQAG